MVSQEEFAQLTPRLSAARRAQILPPLQQAFAEFNINTRLREAHALAQLLHESGGFQFKRELASGRAYEGRRDLGNTHPGDGVRYKGRGWIQVTGRSNYARFGAKLGLDLVNHPELAETDENAARIACAYWDSRGLNAFADKDDLLTITRRINGGTNGLADRRAQLSLAKQVLSMNDPEPAPEDPEEPVRVFLDGEELPFEAFLEDGASWAPLRPLANALGWNIINVGTDSADLQKNGAGGSVPLIIRGARGYSPIRPVTTLAGKTLTYDSGARMVKISG